MVSTLSFGNVIFLTTTIPVAVPERLARLQHQFRDQFDDLRISRFGQFLVRQLHPYLVNVETYVRPVLY